MIQGPLLVVILTASVLFIVVTTARFKLHPFLALMAAAFLVGLCVRMPLPDLVTTINTGFGNMMRHIGLVIVVGTIIGVFLEKSGAALRMAETVLRVVGEKRPQIAMSLIGAIVSVPVFCDSGYVILSSLNKAIARRARVPLASMAVALATGLYSTHTLVPPTPGPIAAAGNIGAANYLGLVILVGLLVSIPAILAGYLWAVRMASHIVIAGEDDASSVEADAGFPGELPAAWMAFAPIVVPVLLIGLGSIISATGYEGRGAAAGLFLGAPVVALFAGLCFALLLLPRSGGGALNAWTAEGTSSSGDCSAPASAFIACSIHPTPAPRVAAGRGVSETPVPIDNRYRLFVTPRRNTRAPICRRQSGADGLGQGCLARRRTLF